MVEIKGIEDGITSQPLITGDAAITIHVIKHENLLNRMTEGFTSFEFSKAMRQLMLKGFDGFAEAFNPFAELVRRHTIRRHHRVEAFAIHMDLFFTAAGISRIQLLA